MTRRTDPDFALIASKGGRGPKRWTRIRNYFAGVSAAVFRADANQLAREAITQRDAGADQRKQQQRQRSEQLKRELGGGTARSQGMRKAMKPAPLVGPAIGEDGRLKYPLGMTPQDYWAERAELAAADQQALPFQVTNADGIRRAMARMEARETVYLPLEAEYGKASGAEEDLLSSIFLSGHAPGDPELDPAVQAAYDQAVDRRIAVEQKLAFEAMSDGYSDWRARRRQFYASRVIANKRLNGIR
ncbi:hypothetical protein [Leifsonia sp. fls2-241-R2A-40a]|uniref:hypothetical protein n=1 Tax=Leifsonia sp. fls2-241-R2A-40a TaxID=3040290 RepID=UPI00255183A9|nr:hypothetical protein [Leifsonia sp. fls2-241-R2A-40a]